jgi:hypothetical protein
MQPPEAAPQSRHVVFRFLPPKAASRRFADRALTKRPIRTSAPMRLAKPLCHHSFRNTVARHSRDPQRHTNGPTSRVHPPHAADSLASVDRSCLRCGCNVDRLWQVSGACCRAAVHAQPKGQRPASDAVLGRTGLMPTWRLSGSGRRTTPRASPPALVYQIDAGRRRLHNHRRIVVADGQPGDEA